MNIDDTIFINRARLKYALLALLATSMLAGFTSVASCCQAINIAVVFFIICQISQFI